MKNIMTVLLVLLIAFMIGCGEETVVSPTISILSPQASVSGKVKIVTDAYSDTEISRVEIYIDGGLAATLTEVSESGLWRWEWDTRELPITEQYSYDYTGHSSHTIYARAEDADGDVTGTEAMGVNVRDYSFEDNTYSNWRYNFQISTEGTDWGINLGGQLPNTYYYTSVQGVVSVTPDAHYYGGGEGNVVFLVSARPYLEGVITYEKMVTSRLEAAYDDPYNPGRVKVDIHAQKGYEMHGVPAKEFEFKVSGKAEGKVICLVKDDMAYAIYMAVQQGFKYSDHKADFSQLLKNFKFLF